MVHEPDKAEDKKREARLRRVAAGMGLALRKSRTRDTGRMDHGLFRVVDVKNDCVVAGRFPFGYTLDLDAVEDVLNEILESREEAAFKKTYMPGHGRAGGFDAKHER
jgi:hypothetical protein